MKHFLLITALLASTFSFCQVRQTEEKLFKAQLLNTNFNIPIVRFNPINKDADPNSQAKGNVSFFNSLGAGVSFNWGRVKKLIDTNTKEDIDMEMSNIIGFQIGCLFSSQSSSGNNANIFAPVLSLNILDFQFGTGYELGTSTPKDKRLFFTLSYGLPLQKLTNKGSFIIKEEEVDSSTKSKFLISAF